MITTTATAFYSVSADADSQQEGVFAARVPGMLA